jgi:hypoxanthine phosphoribosyltransferase
VSTKGPATPEVLVPAEVLVGRVGELAAEISAVSPDGVILVAVLKGSLLFLADLIRQLSVSPEVDFLAISTYAPDSGRVRLVKDLDLDISGRHVVLVEDIVDTGLTLTYLLGELTRRHPASLQVCTLVDKPARRLLPVPLDFVGFEVPDVFVLGYGLDFAGRYRNLDQLVAGQPEVLAADPDAYVGACYGGSLDR